MSDLSKQGGYPSLYPVILNSTNYVTGSNGTFRYNFPTGQVNFKNSKIALASISIYYSWFSIQDSYNNTTLQIVWPVGPTTLNITIPNGFYSIPQLNAYLQSQMVANGMYLINGSGQYVYYLELIENSSAYAVQLNCYPIPTSLPAGYSAPASWLGYPAVASTPQLVVLTNNFRNIIGFSAGTYPSVVQATNYSVSSTFTPQVSPVQSVIVGCLSGVAFGNLIESQPSAFSFVDILDGSYCSFDITLYDQDFNLLPINDTNLIIQLNIISLP